jgi:ribosomal protein L29
MKVLSQIIKFSKELLALKSQVHTNTLQIKEIREDLAQLTSIVKDLKHEIELHQLKQTN